MQFRLARQTAGNESRITQADERGDLGSAHAIAMVSFKGMKLSSEEAERASTADFESPSKAPHMSV